MLVCEGLISEEQLKQGLDAQRESAQERRLGAILVELGFLDQGALESMIAAQIEKVIAEFLDWQTGFFRFEEFELPDRGEVAVDARLLQGGSGNLLLNEGLPPDQVLLELASKLDSANAQRAEGAASPAAEEGSSGVVEDDPNAKASVPGRLDSLRTIMAEFHSPAFTGEGTLMILDYAQRLVRRGVLFSMTALGARGLGQFGLEPSEGSPTDIIRRLTLPPGQRSTITEATSRKSAFVGPLEQTPANRLLIRELGGGWPETVVTAPLIVGGRTLLVFYGDNLPDNNPIGAIDELELVMMHAALAMERSLLAKRVEHLEALQRRSRGGSAPDS